MSRYWTQNGYNVVFPDGRTQGMGNTVQARDIVIQHNEDLAQAIRAALAERDRMIEQEQSRVRDDHV